MAPAGYRPRSDGELCYDSAEVEAIPAWRRHFAGGSNRLHWVLKDLDDQEHLVEQVGFDGPYAVSGPDYDDTFPCAYDAFWTAEERASMSTDPTHPTA